MTSKSLNKSIFIDNNTIRTLEELLSGTIESTNNLSTKEELLTAGHVGVILAPNGKRNEIAIEHMSKGDVVKVQLGKKVLGEIEVDSTYHLDFAEKKMMMEDEFRTGSYGIHGKVSLVDNKALKLKNLVNKKIKGLNASKVTGVFTTATPIHMAIENVLRETLEHTDLIVLFVIDTRDYSMELKLKTIDMVLSNYLVKDRIVVVPISEHYTFSNVSRTFTYANIAKSYGCNKIVLTAKQKYLGLSTFKHDDNLKISSNFKEVCDSMGIQLYMMNDYRYCIKCKTLVTNKNCPHGARNHIYYISNSIKHLLDMDILPPYFIVRKEVSLEILSRNIKHRVKDDINLEELSFNLLPKEAMLEDHVDTADIKYIYKSIINLYRDF